MQKFVRNYNRGMFVSVMAPQSPAVAVASHKPIIWNGGDVNVGQRGSHSLVIAVVAPWSEFSSRNITMSEESGQDKGGKSIQLGITKYLHKHYLFLNSRNQQRLMQITNNIRTFCIYLQKTLRFFWSIVPYVSTPELRLFYVSVLPDL